MKMEVFSSVVAMVTLAAMTVVNGNTVTTPCPTSSTCRNGACVMDTTTGAESCDCGVFFSGTSCETVRLDVPDWTITATTVSFKWPQNVTLIDYEFVCYLKYASDPVASAQNITTSPFDTLTYTGLQPGATTYVICIVDSIGFNLSDPNIYSSTLYKKNLNCFSFSTMYDGRDPATKAAYGIAIMVGSIFLLSLVVKGFFNVRQNKIRLREKGLKSLTKWNRQNRKGSRRHFLVGNPSVSFVDLILQTSSSSPDPPGDEVTGRSASSGDIRASGRKTNYIAPDKRSIGSHGSRGSVPRQSKSNLAVVVSMKDNLEKKRSESRPSVLDMTFEGQPDKSQSHPAIDMM